MKDYNNIIIWLDYFNKSFSRNEGRRVPNNKSIFNPSLDELKTAVSNSGFSISHYNENCKFPKRPQIKSGYISVIKSQTKTKIINKIAGIMIAIRSNQNKSS
ncbi:MAG: hypothetical protein OXF28_03960 [Thaumarchaeota archaeon]|nr:hypothetical protein [Nitrososphaerota archaeon]MCY3976267.1 hypothetical protein [Nitrososphaerota archaeon]